jgi:hypothetical protein
MKKTYQAPITHIDVLTLESSLLVNSVRLEKDTESYSGEFTTKENSWGDIWEE